MEKIVVHGTGSGSEKLIQAMEKDRELFEARIVCFSDNDPCKQGTVFCGKTVCSPADLADLEYDFLVIASVKQKEIRKGLTEQYGLEPDKMYSKKEYCRKCLTGRLYRDRYGGREKEKLRCGGLADKIVQAKKIVVYTANIGKYDEVQEPLVRDDRIDYVCFTDDPDFCSGVWHVEHVKNECGDAPLEVRKYKLFPDRYFPDYEISIWVDSKYLIRGNLFDYVERYAKEQPMLCFPHPERQNIYDEAAECVRVNKVQILEVSRQILHYYDSGLRAQSGLIEGGCLTRLHHDERVKQVMQQWWEEINTFTRRDQISFPYVSWKNAFQYDICDMDINRCEYLQTVSVH